MLFCIVNFTFLDQLNLSSFLHSSISHISEIEIEMERKKFN